MNSVNERIRRMLAKDLEVEEQALTDDYRWVNAMGNEDTEYFLAELNDQFRYLPSGFSCGEGSIPFGDIDPDTLERISTVGGLNRTRGAACRSA